MARKRQISLVKKIAIIATPLIALQIVYILINQAGEKPLQFKDAMQKGVGDKVDVNDARKVKLKIQLALSDYRVKNKKFPTKLEALVPDYFASIPLDPDTAEPFKYTVTSDGGKYTLGDAKEKGIGPGGTGKNKDEESLLVASLDQQSPESNFTYDPTGKRDPLRSYDFAPKTDGESAGTPLEQLTYEQLKLTAVLVQTGEEPKAIIEDSGGKGHTVKIGTKVGPLGGEVVKIEEDKITILETTVEFTGEKNQRMFEMYLRE